MEKPKFTIPMFGNAKNKEFQCLEKPNLKNSNVWSGQNSQFQCLEKEKSGIPMFGIAKIPNSNVWKSQT